MNDFFASPIAGWVAIALMAVGGALTVFLAISLPNSPFKEKWDAYVAYLNQYVRFLLLKESAQSIAQKQAVVIAILLVILAATGNVLTLALMVLVAAGPPVVLGRRKTERIEKLEEQLDGWLLMLANSLKATPAIGEAIKSTVNLVQPPMSEELDLLVKENQLGTPLDQAILNMSERIGSPVISGALATLVIARQTGGDLPTILETSAASLREMARLEGVVRTKTAEGKGQSLVLGVMPFAMTLLLSWIDPNWLTPLTTNFVGYIIITIAMVLWLGAILWARKILAVDI
ncbi:MAG TPA: type II secretion system F family protein [Polyangiaceae bacterium LLY-WYZ-15_(1-7)]|nr:hypothetical protein [Myxococcales bacterium]MAT28561.1 hypothetical protein [Sandaracinus sp.]HJK94884.1 type II secretion system F family protein [Polyangiaceae bacterium LLY-WYZ-15_(1-7)]MBJ74800.1 hypothetical protein [Sandaracinus sp.]HJL01605.1 type II secretion system F family protein [Polyangiaceae bacterium LLY-WYZ-15_(1-7)]